MIETPEKISPLKKVRLSLEAGTVPETMDLTDRPLTFEFIIGIGKGGLAPLEARLMEKLPGDELHLRLNGNELPALLEHLVSSFPYTPQTDAPFYMKLRILGITTPESREVVRAMASTTGCGDGCCGTHFQLPE